MYKLKIKVTKIITLFLIAEMRREQRSTFLLTRKKLNVARYYKDKRLYYALTHKQRPAVI
jgi:hypothetical protein